MMHTAQQQQQQQQQRQTVFPQMGMMSANYSNSMMSSTSDIMELLTAQGARHRASMMHTGARQRARDGVRQRAREGVRQRTREET